MIPGSCEFLEKMDAFNFELMPASSTRNVKLSKMASNVSYL